MVELFMQPLPIIDTGKCRGIVYVVRAIVAALLCTRDAILVVGNIESRCDPTLQSFFVFGRDTTIDNSRREFDTFTEASFPRCGPARHARRAPLGASTQFLERS